MFCVDRTLRRTSKIIKDQKNAPPPILDGFYPSGKIYDLKPSVKTFELPKYKRHYLEFLARKTEEALIVSAKTDVERIVSLY